MASATLRPHAPTPPAADDSGALYAIEVLQAAEHINPNVDARTIKKVFETYDIDHSGGLGGCVYR